MFTIVFHLLSVCSWLIFSYSWTIFASITATGTKSQQLLMDDLCLHYSNWNQESAVTHGRSLPPLQQLEPGVSPHIFSLKTEQMDGFITVQ